MVKKGLGRGFSSLIPTDLIDESLDPTAAQDEQLSQLREVKLTDIVPDPDQPRRSFDEPELEEMALSIKEHGVIQPIIVTRKNNTYQIVAGERRYRAAGKAGLMTIPALVRTLSDQHRLELSLIENIQRRDLNVLETATAYLKLRDQFNLSLDEIGSRVGGKSVSAISNTLRLLRLPDSVKKALQEGKITEGQARPLINADPKVIEQILPLILKEEWSARRIEQFVVGLKKTKTEDSHRQKQLAHDTETQKLIGHLQTKVQIHANAKGAGKIVISFKNDKEFERITKMLER